MNRLISILITLFLIFLLYIWINSVMSKKKNGSEEDIAQTAASAENAQEGDTKDTSYKLSNYNPESKRDPHQKTGSKTKNEPDAAEKIAAAEKENIEKKLTVAPVNQKPPAVETKSEPPVKPQTNQQTKKATDGPHLVIAGNFVTRAYAEARMKDLQDFGYRNAEIVNFDLSEYHTVCAGRFSEIMEARRIAKKIRDYHKIEAYVRVGNE